MSRDTSESDDLAARIALKHPSLDEEMVKATITALIDEIRVDLVNGNQASLDDAITFRLSLNARLDSPGRPFAACR
jgi:nucleoid DNA-binding protein